MGHMHAIGPETVSLAGSLQVPAAWKKKCLECMERREGVATTEPCELG